MSFASICRFILLGAIWGASFLFMRILAPEVGALWTAESRLAIGALTLLCYLQVRGVSLDMQHWRHYVVVGLLNCAVPFFMFGLAGKLLPAGYSAVLNSSVPLWATVFAVWAFNERITTIRALALTLGVLGVVFVAQPSADVQMGWLFMLGVGACLLASACYALSGIYLKKYTTGLKPQAIATMSQTFGALMLLPLALLSGFPSTLSSEAIVSGLLLGVFCSGIAFLLYYRLLEDEGVLLASGVTFLVPLFGILWGAVLLHERLGWTVFMGCALIVVGAYLLYRSNQTMAKK
jgi:drug/metabolite transporter (DMT)-like permease